MKPVQWGVLSTAGIALNRVIPGMLDAPGCHFRAIASRNIDTARTVAERFSIPIAYGSYQEVLDDPEIEAVYIPLPNDMHVEWCVRAMEAGKHVLCEKPLALNAEEIESLIPARDRTGRVIEEAFAFRNHPQWAAMREVVQSGEIGELRGIQAVLAHSTFNPDALVNNLEKGGGALYDLGCYAIAGSRYICAGEPTRVVALLDRDPRFKTDRLSTALLQFPNAHASFTVSTQGGPDAGGTHQHFGILGSKGWVRAEWSFSHAIPSACRLFIGDNTSMGTKPTREIQFPLVNQYALQGSRFSQLVRGESAEQFPLEDSVANMRVIDALFRSERTGGWEAVG